MALRKLMEVTGALSSRAQNARFTFGEDTALVAVQHMLSQTIDLFRALCEIGLKPENIFALGKVYSNSPLVISALRRLGITVIESTMPKPGEFVESFEEDVKQLWRVAAEKLAQRRIKRVIVLDDGGKCIINTPPELLDQYLFAGVEQTSQGIFVFRENPPPFAVFSWARAAVKLQIGGHIFSQCLIEKLNTEFLQGESFQGAEIGIIGLGSIGRGLANAAWRQGCKAVFYDPDPNLEAPQYLQDKVTRVDSLEELMLRCDYLFGSSGRSPFDARWPLAHRPGMKLFSASGGDHEFGSIIRDLKRGPGFRVAADNWDITSNDSASGPLRIAYLGFPYNFVSRATAAVPTRIVQLETGGLLASILQARSFLTLVEEDCEQNIGIHPISLDAQQFVFETWLKAMADRKINIRELYDYDATMLDSANWLGSLMNRGDPKAGDGYEPNSQSKSATEYILGVELTTRARART